MLNVEFIGGPFDGHHQACLVTSGELPSHVIRLVCDDAFGQLEETTQVQARKFTSVAFTDSIASLIPNATFSPSPSLSRNLMCCYAMCVAAVAKRLIYL